MCDTCQDCSCDNITLPVALGDTGPAGPAGAAGSNGADGSVILFNQLTPATTTADAFVDLTGMTYTIPADQLATNGDQLKLKAYFHTNDIKGGEIDVYLDGTTIMNAVDLGMLPGTRGDCTLRLETVITRTSNTNVTAEHFIVVADGTSGHILGAKQFFESTLAVTGLTASTTVLKLRGMNITLNKTLTCYYMSVEFLNKA